MKFIFLILFCVISSTSFIFSAGLPSKTELERLCREIMFELETSAAQSSEMAQLREKQKNLTKTNNDEIYRLLEISAKATRLTKKINKQLEEMQGNLSTGLKNPPTKSKKRKRGKTAGK